jgi:putative FmdB family regulatory protein
MPTYSYQREDGSVFEIMQRMSDPALTECPETGQKVRRLISGGAGVVYKGEGWYVTDYKDRGQSNKTEQTPATTPTVSSESP